MKFRNVRIQDWGIAESVTPQRKARLLRTTYPQIVKALCANLNSATARLESNKRVILGHSPGSLVRTVLTLQFPSWTVDLFHSGAGGYRAQYYLSQRLGNCANAYCCKRLIKVIEQTSMLPPRCRKPFVKSSLKSKHSKVWIGQGLWLRRSSAAIQTLSVQRWSGTEDKKSKKLQRWAKLMPIDETRINLIGGWIERLSESPLHQPSKPDRAKQISKNGFT